jgi:hypothetical protein
LSLTVSAAASKSLSYPIAALSTLPKSWPATPPQIDDSVHARRIKGVEWAFLGAVALGQPQEIRSNLCIYGKRFRRINRCLICTGPCLR